MVVVVLVIHNVIQLKTLHVFHQHAPVETVYIGMAQFVKCKNYRLYHAPTRTSALITQFVPMQTNPRLQQHVIATMHITIPIQLKHVVSFLFY